MGGGSLVEGQGSPTPGALEFIRVWGEDRWWKFIGSKVSLTDLVLQQGWVGCVLHPCRSANYEVYRKSSLGVM